MIREEEDDVTQETRALVVLKIKEETEKLIQKIEAAKVPITDEWTDGQRWSILGTTYLT